MVNINANLFQQKNPVYFGLSKDRRPVVIANHKSGATKDQESKFLSKFKKSITTLREKIINGFSSSANMPEVIIAPSSPFYDMYERSLKDVPEFALGGQNCIWDGEDPYSHVQWPLTGELTIGQLKSCGVKYIFVGHIERKDFQVEDTLQTIHKVSSILTSEEKNIFPIICLREKFEHKNNRAEAYKDISLQLSNYLMKVRKKEDFKKLSKSIIAYEPFWPTEQKAEKLPCDPKTVNNAAKAIRESIYEEAIVREFTPKEAREIANKIRITYGAFVTDKNIDNYLTDDCAELDGLLVGRPGLNNEIFAPMLSKTAVKWNEILQSK